MAGNTKPSATALSSAPAALNTSVAATARMEAARAPIESIVVTDGHGESPQIVTCPQFVALLTPIGSIEEALIIFFIPAIDKIRAQFKCYSQIK